MDKAQAQELLVDAKSVFLNNYKMKEALLIILVLELYPYLILTFFVLY